MDAEGLGRKLLLTLSGDPRSRTPEKQTVGTVTASQTMLTLQALSSSLHAGAAKGACLGRGEAFGCPPAVCPPERPCPFTHYQSSYPAEVRKWNFSPFFSAKGVVKFGVKFSALCFPGFGCAGKISPKIHGRAQRWHIIEKSPFFANRLANRTLFFGFVCRRASWKKIPNKHWGKWGLDSKSTGAWLDLIFSTLSGYALARRKHISLSFLSFVWGFP